MNLWMQLSLVIDQEVVVAASVRTFAVSNRSIYAATSRSQYVANRTLSWLAASSPTLVLFSLQSLLLHALNRLSSWFIKTHSFLKLFFPPIKFLIADGSL